MDPIDMLGYAAAFLTTAAFVPQVVRVWRTRSTEDISFLTFAALVTGIVGWLVYGVVREEPPIILANGATLVLAGTILVFKIRAKFFGAEGQAAEPLASSRTSR